MSLGLQPCSLLNPGYSGVQPVQQFLFAQTGSLLPVRGTGQITFTRGSSATYFNSVGTLTAAATDVARFDYDPSTLAAIGLLIEEARTNSFLQSKDISNAAWTKVRASTPGTTTTSPDGTSNGQKLVEDSTAAATHFYRQDIAVTAGSAYTWSFYAKASERNQLQTAFGSDAGIFAGEAATFTLSGSGLVSNSGATNPSIVSVGNGWYLCRLTATATTTGTAVLRNQLAVASNPVYNGDGTSGLYIYGNQFELGAFGTSTIHTTTAAVTRSADVASMTGTNFSSWYNQTQGTFVVKARMSAPAISAYGPYRIDDGTDTQRVMLRDSGGGLLGFVIIDGGVTQANLSAGNTITANALFSHAAAYQLNDIATSYNGAAVLTDNAATIPAVNRMLIGVGGTTTSYLNGWISSLSYYPVRNGDTLLQRESL